MDNTSEPVIKNIITSKNRRHYGQRTISTSDTNSSDSSSSERKKKQLSHPPQVYDRRGAFFTGNVSESTQEMAANSQYVAVHRLHPQKEVYQLMRLQRLSNNGLIQSEPRMIIAPTDSLNLEL